MTPEHDRTNPQRAIDEYKHNTIKCRYCNDTGWEDDVVITAYGIRQGFECVHCKKNTPPLIKLGQGREEQPSDKTIEVIYVSFLVGGLIALLMFVCYLAGGWQ
jgi:hypothetical protein